MSAQYEILPPGGHETYATSIFSKIKTYLDSNPYGYVSKAGDTMTGNLTAPKFIGALQGNADTASSAIKATQDESGNNIKSTYASAIGISGHTITLKNKNGTSLGTVTVPDNNTTYSLSASGENVVLTGSDSSSSTADLSSAFAKYTPYKGNLTSLGSASPASAMKTYWDNNDNIKVNSVNTAYNTSGQEYAFLLSKGGSNQYGAVIRWGYGTKYFEILRKYGSTWKDDDWVKMDAGYADKAWQLVKVSNLDTADKLDAFTGTDLSYASVSGGLVTSSTDGLVMSIPWNEKYGQQIYLDDSSYAIKHRYHNNGTWSDWKSLIDESNINDYAPTKTGTGASGTWGISITGNADTASKLGSSNVGSATQPIYLNSGTATACTYTLGKSVPSDAVFTDTLPTAYCNSAANATAKIAQCTGFSLKDNSYIPINFKNGNTVARGTGVTLNINNTGAKPVYVDFDDDSVLTDEPFDAGTYILYYTNQAYYLYTNGVLYPYRDVAKQDDLRYYSFGSQDGSVIITEGSSTSGGATTYTENMSVQKVNGHTVNKDVPSNAVFTDTKNTAGSTDTSSKIYLIGATSQAANPQTYSQDTAYVGTDGCLYSGGSKVLTAHQDISGKADKSATVSTVTWSNNKLTKTINGTTSDVVSAATILGNLTSSQVTTALGYTPASVNTTYDFESPDDSISFNGRAVGSVVTVDMTVNGKVSTEGDTISGDYINTANFSEGGVYGKRVTTYGPWGIDIEEYVGTSLWSKLGLRDSDILLTKTWDGTHDSLKQTIAYLGSQSAANKVDKAGDTISGDLDFAGGNVFLRTPSSSSDDSGDIAFYYGNGAEKCRIWTSNEYTAAAGPNYRVYKKDGSALYSGRLATMADLSWGNISGKPSTFPPSSHSHDYLPTGGGTMTGIEYSKYASQSWVNSLTKSAITLTDDIGFGGWICGPTKNGRITIATYKNGDDILYFGYGERGRTQNSYTRRAYWNGANGMFASSVILGESMLRSSYIGRNDSGDSGYINHVNTGNTAYAPTRASAFTTMSCKYTKTNVVDISEEDALKLLDIRPVNFDYIEEVGGQKDQIGVLAEDTYEVLPKVVSVPDDYVEEDFDISKGIHQPLPSVDYAKFVPYLIKLVQIQQKEINELRADVQSIIERSL